MKVKKILLSIISMLVLISLALTSKVFAADVSVYFGIIQKGPSGWGYAIGDPTNRGSQIWNIVKYKGSNKASGYDWKDAYCARAGRGLGNMTTGVADTEVHNYVNAFNMRTEKETILNYGSDATLNGQVNRILPTANTKIAGTEVTCYDAILSVADLVYLREDANKDSYKEELMTKALEKTVNQYSDYNYKITEDDIIAVQQAVIWYFTNYDETKYNLLENASWLSYVTDTTTTYTSLNDYRPNGQGSNDEGPQRQEQAVALYKYLINTAIENAKNSNYKGINPVTLYTNIADITGTQPIIIIEKGEEKEFDLALRKYITKVDDHELTNSNETRIPNPNTTKLESGEETTAQYNHRKNPVKVKTGSKVTYNLTIYNEGEVAGRATKISDQLPTGLKLDTTGTVTSEKGNVYQISVDANNKVTLVTDGTNNINAFDGTNLDKDTVSIVCEVTQTASTQSDIILTNLAWIAEEVNASTNTVITNQKGEDRDSEPSTIDTKTADQLKTTDIGYTGKDNYSKEQLNDSTKYFKGGQDDDDFEKVILEQDTRKVDLALRKYIVSITNNSNTTILDGNNSRVPDVKEDSLLTGTTATYNHKKDPVEVEEGSLVNYKLTIYNEGNMAGRATKVVDQLPAGLEFVSVVSGNFEKDTYNETTNKLTLKRKDGNETNLPAYEEGKLVENSETIEIQCKVTAKADKENNKVLTNIAWIEDQVDEAGRQTDRDSTPGNTNVSGSLVTTDNGYTNNDSTDLNNKDHYFEGQEDDDDFEKVVLKPKAFDLKLIKRIVEVNGQEVPERIKNVDVSKLNTKDENGNLITTADYDLDKTPVQVKKGDIVKYTFRIYNEGDIDGFASEITEDIPEGLEFIYSTKQADELDADTTLTAEEKAAIKFNQSMLWIYDSSKIDANGKILEIKTDYLSKEVSEDNLIKAFNKETQEIDYKEVSVMLKVVTEDTTGKIIRNEACISEDSDKDGNDVDDRDSNPKEWKKYEDDEDYDNIVPGVFDLALRKFIVAVSKDETIENTEYMKNEDGTYTRAPKVDTSKLNTKDENGKLITTAIYNHTKEPVQVQKGNYVVYMLRVYNEGSMAGYAAQIKDHLPEYLEFVDGDFNKKYGWEVSEDGRTVTTKYLSGDKYLIEAAVEKNGKIELDYKDVPIMCKVKSTAKTGEKVTNIADISIYEDEKHKEIGDRDSSKDNVKLPDDKDLPSYKDDEKGDYIPGQEDDDDFEKVIIKKFDLALRKFITAVNDKEVTTRIPVPQMGEDGNIKYNHTKEPVEVTTKDIVTYTLRVYNEGEINGYASKVSDDLPEGLEFLPENSLNKEMRWVMYDKDGKETTNVKDAVKITTDYLSKEQGEERMKQDSSLKENPNLIKAFDTSKDISDTNPDYKEVKIAFKVVEPNSSKKILVNAAQISDDSDEDGNEVDDEDSIPDKWNEGEDDQDKEYVKLVEFDLALRKWVTQAIVIENGKQTVTNTGHQPYDDPEAIVKVELHRKKLKDVTVKFKYSIRVINEGDIEGYAKEVTDYIPEGLKFVASDNPGWTDKGNNVITTRLLENTLLKPGEYADVEVLLTWVNNENNMGLKTNIAEISEDYNDKGVPDRDSTPNNKKDGEDDIDDAPVMLSISTGKEKVFIILGVTVLITIAGGVVLIKKFVL